MAAWVVCALCAIILIKPQEVVPELSKLPLVHLLFGLCFLCLAIDIAWRRVQPRMAPQIRYGLWFLFWSLIVTAVKSPDTFGERIVDSMPTTCVFVAISLASASPRGLRAIAVTLVGCAGLVTVVAIVQSNNPYECMRVDINEDGTLAETSTPDGRPCETSRDCLREAPDPGGEYLCERPGPLQTRTIAGRVRYRGSLEDPNELSLMAGMMIPFAVALVETPSRRRRASGAPGASRRLAAWASAALERARTTERAVPRSRVAALARTLYLGATMGGVGFMVVLAQSRTGVIVYVVVMGLCLLRWYGPRGLFAAGLASTPMLLFGGRSGEEANSSKDARVELLREGFEMIRQTKGFGVGAGRFHDECSTGQTAHNAYLLAGAEAGAIGLCLFGLLLYSSLKVSLELWLGDHDVDPAVARFAPAVFVSQVGAMFGIFFLSWSYKDVLYMLLGVSSALYGAAQRQDPRFVIRLSPKEAALVCCGMFGLLVVLNLTLHIS